jgi:hypothetical protein
LSEQLRHSSASLPNHDAQLSLHLIHPPEIRLFPSGQVSHSFYPGPTHVRHSVKHSVHFPLTPVMSVRTRLDGQVRQSVSSPPLQVAQVLLQVTHDPPTRIFGSAQPRQSDVPPPRQVRHELSHSTHDPPTSTFPTVHSIQSVLPPPLQALQLGSHSTHRPTDRTLGASQDSHPSAFGVVQVLQEASQVIQVLL